MLFTEISQILTTSHQLTSQLIKWMALNEIFHVSFIYKWWPDLDFKKNLHKYKPVLRENAKVTIVISRFTFETS